MSDKITTLHPKNNLNVNVYPNVKDENIPDTILRVADLGTAINDLGDYTFTSTITFSDPVTFSSSLDVEGKATFGSDAEVDGKLTINTATDLVIKDGTTFAEADYNALDTKIEANTTLIGTKADSTDLESFKKVYYANTFVGAYAGMALHGYETDYGADVDLTSWAMTPALANATNISLILASSTISTGNTPVRMTFKGQNVRVWSSFDNLQWLNSGSNTLYLNNGKFVIFYGFRYSNVKKVLIDDGYTSSITRADCAFCGATSLEEVGAFDMSACTNSGLLSQIFVQCTSLKSIHCTHWKASFSISDSTQFEEDDLVEIIGNLDTVSTAQTLTMGSTNLAKLTTDEILVATGKGWTLA